MKKTWYSLRTRVTAMLLTLICILGLLPTAAFAAGADTIKLDRFGMSGVSSCTEYWTVSVVRYAHNRIIDATLE